jgi:hypothetical protein
MRISFASFGLCLVLIAAHISCVKSTGTTNYTGNQDNSKLTLSKTVVEKGEPLLASTTNSNANAIIRWQVHPAGNTVILPSGDKAAIFITNAGSYQVTANYYSPSDTTIAYDSSNSSITVNDSVYTPPPVSLGYDTASLAGDQITLIPTASLDSGLVILAKTANLYKCYPYLTAYGWSQAGVNSSLDFDFRSAEVVEGNTDCAGMKNAAFAYMPTNISVNGVYTVTATFNGVSYQGSLTVTDAYYTFTWNYTSGIIISPLQIPKK